MKFTKKLIGFFSITAIILASVQPGLAYEHSKGRRSGDRTSIEVHHDSDISQSNNAHFNNNIHAYTNTGGSRGNDRSRIRTGDAASVTQVENYANFNYSRIGSFGFDWWDVRGKYHKDDTDRRNPYNNKYDDSRRHYTYARLNQDYEDEKTRGKSEEYKESPYSEDHKDDKDRGYKEYDPSKYEHKKGVRAHLNGYKEVLSPGDRD